MMPAPASVAPPAVASPCIGVCQLDANSVCCGCGRSIGEIAEWSRADDARRQGIVRAARERLASGRA